MTSIDKDKVGEEIVKSFHEQFAQNQNHHQTLFLQVLTVLLTVLIGYGYLYIRVNVKAAEINVTPETIYVFLVLASYILSLSIALISNMALGFRRDQIVACNIRVKTGVMSKKGDEDSGYFLQSFNPVGKTKYLLWMPEFHLIFFAALLLVKILLLLGSVLNSNFGVVFSCSPNILISGSIIMVIFSFGLDIYIALHYWRKWKKYSDTAPVRLQ